MARFAKNWRAWPVVASATACALLLSPLGASGAAEREPVAQASAAHTRIVYLTSLRNAGIFAMNPNGTRRHRLRGGLVDAVSVSAGGRQMAFAHSRSTPCSRCPADSFVDVFVAGGNGRNARKVRRFRHAHLFSLAMSFDGRRIVLSIYRGGSADLYLMRANGRGVRRLTKDERDQSAASFSPNGKRIVFSQDDPAGTQIYSMRARGGDRRRLTGGAGFYGDPVYSPDGKRIAYTKTRGRNSEIFLMSSRGGDRHRVTTARGAREDYAPDFSPNGRSIAFQRRGGARFEIFTVRVDGSNLRRVARGAVDLLDPDWTRKP